MKENQKIFLVLQIFVPWFMQVQLNYFVFYVKTINTEFNDSIVNEHKYPWSESTVRGVRS